MTKEQDENRFRALLAKKDAVFKRSYNFPYLDEPLVVYFKILKSGEQPDSDLSGYSELSAEDRSKRNLQAISDKVFAMIDKANRDGATPEEFKVSRQMWDELRRDIPEVHDRIAMDISGLSGMLEERFFGGRNPPGPSSS